MQVLAAFLAAAAVGVAGDAPPEAASGAGTKPLLACRSVVDVSARLACFDREAAAFEQGLASRQLLVIRPSEIRNARRSLFGFSLPRLPLFGGDSEEEEEAREIAAKVDSARALGNGKWRIKLDSGAVWETTESVPDYVVPEPGANVRIRKAALGTYLMNIGAERAVRARRIG
jgi:hypothetical protein